MITSTYPSKTHNAIADYISNFHADPSSIDELTTKYGIGRITPDMVPDNIKQIYINQADETLNPWYQNEKAIGSAKLGTQVSQNEADYQNAVDKLNQGLTEDTAALADKEGQNGTWGSSARAERQNSLANKYNNNYNSAYSNAWGALQNQGLANEQQYGVAMPDSSLKRYQVSGNQGVTNGVTARYNPFGIQSSLGVNKQYAANNLATDYLSSKLKNPNAPSAISSIK